MDADAAADLAPAQQRILTDLLARDQPRPRFDPSLAAALRADLDAALAPALDAGPALGESLWVSKHALAQVHSCEANYVGELGWSGWTLPLAEGEVTHRAIQLSVSLPTEAPPTALVDHAMGELAHDQPGSLAGFLGGLSPPACGELRARATNAVSTFLECWPPLPPSWWPRTELPVRADVCGGRVVLSGKIDLVLGRAHGGEARCLFVDLKTGGRYGSHLDDLRFYALVQTLRIGVPPFRVASYYLDSASFAAEDVTVDTLEIALRRTVEGARKMIELRTLRRQPEITPCPRCRYCRIRQGCEGAQAWESRQQAS